MSRKPANSTEAAARLLAALEGSDPLSHAEAQALLQAYVAAELAGVDVDSAPEYADLTQHLGRCEECLALYEELRADLALMLDEGEPLPEPPPMPGGLVKAEHQRENLLLRVFAGLRRRFEASLAVPRLAPGFAALGGGKRAVLVNEQLADVAGAPVVSISLGGEAGARDLLVAVADEEGATRWEVRLTVGGMSLEATTDERGLARFSGLALDEGDRIAVFVAEADEQ